MSAGLDSFLSLKELGDAPVAFDIAATPAEQLALRDRFGVLGLDGMRAWGQVEWLRGGAALRLTGQLQAVGPQRCGVTPEPGEQRVDERFALDFGEAADALDPETGELVLAADQDLPDPIPPDGLPVGALVTEQLALAIDPYPRKEGADLQAVLKRHGLDADAGRVNPFAALAGLKTKT